MTVNGKTFNGVMPAWDLPDEDIANVMTYIYNSWGNSGLEVRPADVQANRGQANLKSRAKARALGARRRDGDHDGGLRRGAANADGASAGWRLSAVLSSERRQGQGAGAQPVPVRVTRVPP